MPDGVTEEAPRLDPDSRIREMDHELALALGGLERQQIRIAALEETNSQLEDLVFQGSLLNRLSQVAQDEIEVAPIAGRILDLVGRVLQAPTSGILAWDGHHTAVFLSDGAGVEFGHALRACWPLAGNPAPSHGPADAMFIPIRRGSNDIGVLGAQLPLSSQFDLRQHEILVLFARELGPLLERGFATARAQDHYEARLDFVRDLTHDLRNPLTGILSTMLSLLNPEFGFKPEVMSRLIGGALRSARQLDALLDDLLDVHRSAAGRLEIECDPVDVAALIRESAANFEQAALSARLRFLVEFPGGRPESTRLVRADRRLLERVIGNLVANALKFTPAGEVRVLVGDARAGWIDFRVEDSGPGIPPEVQEHVFQPYYRAPAAAHEVPGTGLGLAFCKGAVEGMGGRIWVEASSLGGSAFCVALPEWVEPT